MDFSDVNDEPIPDEGAGSERNDGRFRLISTLISTPDALPKGEKAFRALEQLVGNDFLALTETLGMPGESKIYADLLTLLEDLHELVEFPYLANKNIVAVGGEFSAGKSRFLNAVFSAGELLPTGINPTTAIPTYITQSNSEKILALNTFNRQQELTRDELAAISHGFNENQTDSATRISFYHILKLLQVQSPEMAWENIAFLDTPGYSKPKESTGAEDDSAGTSAGNTDEEKAREHLSSADYLVWVVSAADGTFQQPGIVFLRDKVRWNKPLYIVVNKADQKTSYELKAVFSQICDAARDAGFKVAGACAYSSREKRLYLGDDPMKWFDDIDGKIKFTRWRGRFKAIVEKVVCHCADINSRYAVHEKTLKEIELGSNLDSALAGNASTLRRRLGDERKKQDVAIARFKTFTTKAEALLEKLLTEIGVSDENAHNIGIVAVCSDDEKMMKCHKGDVVPATVEHFSKFGGVYLRSDYASEQIQIRRGELDHITDAARTFAPGKQIELVVYDVDFAARKVTLNVKGSGVAGVRTDKERTNTRKKRLSEAEAMAMVAGIKVIDHSTQIDTGKCICDFADVKVVEHQNGGWVVRVNVREPNSSINVWDALSSAPFRCVAYNDSSFRVTVTS